MKKPYLIVFVLFCFTNSVIAQNMINLELNSVKQAATNIHYLAKVKVIKAEAFHEGDGSEKHVYSAEVLATYKGKTHKKLSYEMVVEQGEDVVFNSAPVYVALCLDEKGAYYWPGTGSEFKPSLVIDTWLTENKSNVEKISTDADWCE